MKHSVAGWLVLSVRGSGNPECEFRWMSAARGNYQSWLDIGSMYAGLPHDLAFCMVAGDCAPVTDVAIELHDGNYDSVYLRYTAPVAGRYFVYATKNPQNDGDPRGSDPDWYLLTVHQMSRPGLQSHSTTWFYAPYLNFVVVHDCLLP